VAPIVVNAVKSPAKSTACSVDVAGDDVEAAVGEDEPQAAAYRLTATSTASSRFMKAPRDDPQEAWLMLSPRGCSQTHTR
jgi:hypothetical protein